MSRKLICTQYFQQFSQKNITWLAEHFAEEVTLRDWEISAIGKTSVLKANQGIFDGVTTIEIRPQALYEDYDIVAAELEIEINGKDILKVVDVIEFNKENKIRAIRAYKG